MTITYHYFANEITINYYIDDHDYAKLQKNLKQYEKFKHSKNRIAQHFYQEFNNTSLYALAPDYVIRLILILFAFIPTGGGIYFATENVHYVLAYSIPFLIFCGIFNLIYNQITNVFINKKLYDYLDDIINYEKFLYFDLAEHHIIYTDKYDKILLHFPCKTAGDDYRYAEKHCKDITWNVIFKPGKMPYVAETKMTD